MAKRTIHESACIACGKVVDTSKTYGIYPDGLICQECLNGTGRVSTPPTGKE